MNLISCPNVCYSIFLCSSFTTDGSKVQLLVSAVRVQLIGLSLRTSFPFGSLRSWRYCVGARLKLVAARDSSAVKSHSTILQRLRRQISLDYYARTASYAGYPIGEVARSHARAARERRRESEKRRKKSSAPCGSLSSPEMESLLGQARCRWSVTWYRDALGRVLLSIMAVLYHETDHLQRAYFSRHY